MKETTAWLKRWPLLLMGLTVIGIGISLFGDKEDPSDARALLLGLGCVLTGAGITMVVWNRPSPHDPVEPPAPVPPREEGP